MKLCIKCYNLSKHEFEIGNAVLLIHNMIYYLHSIRNYNSLYVLAYWGAR